MKTTYDPGAPFILAYGTSIGLTAIIFLIIGLFRGVIPDGDKTIALVVVIIFFVLVILLTVDILSEHMKKKKNKEK